MGIVGKRGGYTATKEYQEITVIKRRSRRAERSERKKMGSPG
jgi:hypothetical protein